VIRERDGEWFGEEGEGGLGWRMGDCMDGRMGKVVLMVFGCGRRCLSRIHARGMERQMRNF